LALTVTVSPRWPHEGASWQFPNAAKRVQDESIRYTSRGRRSRHLVTKN
jgi:hypothetical protein